MDEFPNFPDTERPRWYVLKGHTPVPAKSQEEALSQFANSQARRVALTVMYNEVVISTVFLGLDHNWTMEGPPVLFETMVFVKGELGQSESVEEERCCTWEEAEAIHNIYVQRWIRQLTEPKITALLPEAQSPESK